MPHFSLFRSLRSRLTLAFISLAVSPILVVGLVLSYKSTSSLKNEAISHQQIEAERIAIAVEDYVLELERVLELTSKVHGFMSLIREEQQNILDELIAYENRFDALTLVDSDGNELIRSSRIQVVSPTGFVNRSNDPAFQRVVQSNMNYFSPVEFNTVTGEPHMTIAIPLQSFQTGDIEYVLFATVRLKKIWDLLASLSHTDQSIFIVDERGNIVGHPDPSVALGGQKFELPDLSSGLAVGLSGEETIMATKRLQFGEQSMHIVAQMEKEKALRLSREIMFISLLLVVVALILAASLSALVIGSIVRPLHHLSEVARTIQQGDLNQQVEYSRDDEVGELGQAFNDMTRRLRLTIENLEKEVAERKNEIAERKRAEKEKHELSKQLQQAQKMEAIGNLAGGIAHDFNNILASILGYTELSLDEVEKGSEIEGNLREIYTGGLRAKEIVNQILAFARKSDEEIKPTRIADIVSEALKLIGPSTPATIEIQQEVESSSLIMGNATQIHQIMMNLSTNAVHAMQDAGGILKVTLKDVFFGEGGIPPEGLRNGSYIKLTISDTGYGIMPEHIDSIFDPYFTTKDTGEGTGMGLAMVRGTVESYGGTISVDSTPFEKTTFTIYLPTTSKLDNKSIYEAPVLPKGSAHILFVDDEPPIARVGSKILESLGYKVTTKTSSIEALELFKAKPGEFQLVITDMTMPHMTGDKLAIALKQIRGDIPIILCTGYSSKINLEIAEGIGIDAYTNKPLSKADLAKTVKEVLEKV